MGQNEPVSRREWLRRGMIRVAAGTGLVLLGWMLLDVWRGAGRFSSARWVQVAAADSFPPEQAYPLPEKGVAVIRRGNRLAALSLECTHLGCIVHATGGGFYCPCHGSEFGPLGELYSGPATRPLPWHVVEIRRGRLWVHTGRKLERPVWVGIA